MSRDVRRHSTLGSARRSSRSVGLLAAALLVAGCSAIEGPEQRPLADITVINGASDEILVKVDGQALGGNTPAGDFSTRFLLTSGARTVRVEPAPGSSLTGGQSVSLPEDGTGSGQGKTWVVATSTLTGAISAELIDDRDANQLEDVGRLRVIHASADNRELDVWYANNDTPTLSRIASPFEYGETSPFAPASGQSAWRIVVTPRLGPGEDPEANELAGLDVTIGAGVVVTLVLMDDAVNGVRIFQLP